MIVPGKEKILLFVCLLVLSLFFSGMLFFSHQQGVVKSPAPPGRGVLNMPHPTPSPTASVLFSDNFSDNSQNWDVGIEGKSGSTIGSGKLTLTNANHKLLLEPLPSKDDYDDVAVSATVTLLEGDENDSVGLYFRANGSQGYYIDIYGDNSFDIVKATVDATQKTHITYLAASQHSAALHAEGQMNDVKVIMKADTIILLVNDTIVKSVQDSTFSSGKILLFVENGDSSTGVTATFDTIAVYDAPEHLPN